MPNQLALLFVLLLAVIFLAVGETSLVLAIPVDAVWMYGFPAGWDNQTEVGFLSSLNINRVFLSMGNVLSHRKIDPASGSFDAAYTSRLTDFITLANASGISVHAMTLEDPSFTLTANHAFGQGLIANILAYNTNHPTAAFDGVHLDTEPNDPQVWTGAPNDFNQLEGLMQQYENLAMDVRTQIDAYENAGGHPVAFSATVAWWFNEHADIQMDLPHGDAVLLAQHLDVIVPLVFGGTGSTAQEIIDRATDEILEAPTLIGIGSTDILTYSERLAVINALNNQFVGQANYQGTATFHYELLKEQFVQNTIPEPSALVLFGLGLLVILGFGWRRRTGG